MQWSLKLADGLSGPAGTAASSAAKLGAALGGVSTESAKADEAMKKAGDSAAGLGKKAKEGADGVDKLSKAQKKAQKRAQVWGDAMQIAARQMHDAHLAKKQPMAINAMTRSLNNGIPKLNGFAKAVQFGGRYFGPKGAAAVMMAGRAYEKYGASVHKVGGVLASVGATAATAGVALGAIAMGGAVAGAIHIREAQAFRESTMRAFTTILRSKTEAKSVFDKAAKTSFEIGADFRASMGSTNTLLARGFDANAADGIVRMMADLKMVNPAADVDRMVTAIAQVKGKGKLMAEELQGQLGESMDVGAVKDEIAKLMGKKTRDEVDKLMQKGKVDAKTGIQAIQNVIRNQVSGGKAGYEFGDLAKAATAGSLEGTIAQAMNLKEQLLGSIKIDWSPLQNAIKRVMAFMQSDKGAAFLEKVGGTVDKLVSKFDKVSDSDIEAFFEKSTEALDLFVDGVDAAVELVEALGPAASVAFDTFKVGTEGAIGAVKLITAAVEALSDALGWAKSNADSLKSAMTALGGGAALNLAAAANDNGSGSGGMSSKGQSMGLSLGSGLSIGMGLATGQVGAAAAALGGVAANGLAGALKIHSPSRVFQDLGSEIPAGLSKGIGLGAPAVQASTFGMAMAAQTAATGAAAARTVNSSSTDNSRNLAAVVNIYGGADGDMERQVRSGLRLANLTAA